MKTIPLTCAAVGCAILLGCTKTNPNQPQSTSGNQTTLASANAGDLSELKAKWIVGKKYLYHLEMIRTDDKTLPNQSKPTKQVLNVEQDLAITAPRELSNGGRQLDMEFVAQKLETTTGDHKVTLFDSAQDPSHDSLNSTAAMFRKMIGAHVRFLTGAEGKIETLEGYDALVRQVGGNQPQLQEMFRRIFTEDLLKRYCSFEERLPDHGVKIGDSWTFASDVISPIGFLSCDFKSTFKGREQHGDYNCARLEYSGDLTGKAEKGDSDPSSIIEKGRLTGQTWFDADLGMLVDSISEENLTVKDTRKDKASTTKFNQKMSLKLLGVLDQAK